ncbi:hypothetical protein BRADI_4g26546v3 [Brachypodium distachyon]|uniref:Uncharacterized protein n=1 Tax=Brachypodium distachyon TaxID=15368 RepID=A0A0Q3LAQ8_BRADI|nr:hypothetical protein BRADI_4g26546v3 [Brachypodium distachyon]
MTAVEGSGKRQQGQTRLTASHRKMQPLWNECEHGMLLTAAGSPSPVSSKLLRHTAQQSSLLFVSGSGSTTRRSTLSACSPADPPHGGAWLEPGQRQHSEAAARWSGEAAGAASGACSGWGRTGCSGGPHALAGCSSGERFGLRAACAVNSGEQLRATGGVRGEQHSDEQGRAQGKQLQLRAAPSKKGGFDWMYRWQGKGRQRRATGEQRGIWDPVSAAMASLDAGSAGVSEKEEKWLGGPRRRAKKALLLLSPPSPRRHRARAPAPARVHGR